MHHVRSNVYLILCILIVPRQYEYTVHFISKVAARWTKRDTNNEIHDLLLFI
jgi:hypothetical protein